MNFTFKNVLEFLASVSLVTVLFAPPLKTRFGLPDLYSYYLPAALFGTITLFLIVSHGKHTIQRLKSSTLYLLLLTPLLYAFVLGGGTETALLTIILVNFGLSIATLLFPWDEKSLHYFLVACAGFAFMLALHTMLYYGSDGALYNASQRIRDSYLSLSLAIGYGCIASLYLLIRRVSLITVLLFSTCWLGFAVARGRGAFISGVVVLLLYLFSVLYNDIGALKRSKKFLLLGLTITIAPLVIMQLLSLGMNKYKWSLLLFDTQSEIDDGGRGDLMKEAMEKIADAPIFGNGLGEYLMYGGHPHNLILQYGVDGGFIAMFLLLIFLFLIGRKSIVAFNSIAKESKNLLMATFCMYVYVIIHMMKSSDAYLGREFFILCSISIATVVAVRSKSYAQRRKLRRAKRTSHHNL